MNRSLAGETPAPDARQASLKLYFAVWRWHFYAGLYVAPFLIMLATTGLIMLWSSVLDGRDGERIAVDPAGVALAHQLQADAAVAALENGGLVEYIGPKAFDRAAVFRVDVEDAAHMVAVDPYSAEMLAIWDRQAGWYDFAADIHGSLLIGTTGDRLIEIAAGLGIVMVVTGLYLWWPRDGTGLSRALVPDLKTRGRRLFKSLHRSIGLPVSVLLVAVLITGLSWSGIWGERFVQAWSTFPAEKWDAVPLSDATHAAMNHGATKDVPWGLEQTPMPLSGSAAGTPGVDGAAPFDLDDMVAFGRRIGFEGRFRVVFPASDSAVWTLSQDSMSNDSESPTQDRTVHVDQYTGRVLADVGYADYSLGGKAMAVGVAFHEGDLGAWNVALNTFFCLSIIFLSISGIVMWWIRRPKGSFRLAPPPMPRESFRWRDVVIILAVLSMLFPLAGLALLAVLALDLAVIRHVGPLARMLR